MTATQLPTTKTGLRKITIANLVPLAEEMGIVEAKDLTKNDLIATILERQESGMTTETETAPETEAETVQDVAEDTVTDTPEVDPGKQDAEAELVEVPATPKSLAELPTWNYVVMFGHIVESSTNMRRAFGSACDAVHLAPTKELYEQVRSNLKEIGSIHLTGEDGDGETERVSIYRARAF